MVHFSVAGTNIENAIDLPSGDHLALRGASATWVICVAAPSASTQRTKSCAPFGSPSARYIRRLPSGDHRGVLPFTRNRFCDPSAFRIHNSESHLSSSLLTCWRGETEGGPAGAGFAGPT